MTDDTIFIYHLDLYPNFPLTREAISNQFSRLRELSNDHEGRVFPNSRILPPTMSNFQNIWNRYIFPNQDQPIEIKRPYYFSDLYEVLHDFNFYFAFEQPQVNQPYAPQMITSRITDVDIRYCLILAAINTLFYLKNIILARTYMFNKVDYIVPVQYDAEDINLRQLSSQIPQKILCLNIEVYRELDYFLMTKQIDDFWDCIIYIGDQIAPIMIELTNNSPSLNHFLNDALFAKVREDHGELKSAIISKLNEKDVPESVIGALYDLIIEHQMRLPNF